MGLYDRDYMREESDDDYKKGGYGYAAAPIDDTDEIESPAAPGERPSSSSDGPQYQHPGSRAMFYVNVCVAAVGIVMIASLVVLVMPMALGADSVTHRHAIGTWTLELTSSVNQRFDLERRLLANRNNEINKLLANSLLQWVGEMQNELGKPDPTLSFQDWQLKLNIRKDNSFVIQEVTPRGTQSKTNGTWSISPDDPNVLVLKSGQKLDYLRLNVDRMVFLATPDYRRIALCTVRKPVGWRW